MGWLRREVVKAIGNTQALHDAADAEAARKRAIDNLKDLGSQALMVSKFGDHGLPVWVEEHHSLPVPPIVRMWGVTDEDGEAIYNAVLNGDVEALRPLLAKFLPAKESDEPAAEPAPDAEAQSAPAEAQWELIDRYGWQPPAVAAAHGHLETLELVLAAGCSANAQNPYSGWSALHRWAAALWVGLGGS